MAQVWRISGLTPFGVTTEMPAPAPLHGMRRTLDPASMPLPLSDTHADTGRKVGHFRDYVGRALLRSPVSVSGLVEKQAKVCTLEHAQKPGRKRGRTMSKHMISRLQLNGVTWARLAPDRYRRFFTYESDKTLEKVR